MKQFLRILILLACMFDHGNALCTHVSGCDIQYSFRNKDTVDLTVTMYRDCKSASMSGIQIDVVGIGCSYTVSYANISPSVCKDITPVCKTSCSKCSDTNCNAYGYPNGSNSACNFPYGMEKVVFYKTISLINTNCCKFRFAVSQCCRGAAITTCCSGENFFTYAEADRCLPGLNSSPKFNNDPVTLMCVGNCASINIGGIDTSDYDSISYRMAQALTAFGSPCTYQGSYTYQYPLYYDGFPNTKKFNPSTCKGLMLDSTTGALFFKPMQQQIAVIAVEVKEWRRDTTGKKMINIGLTRRDFKVIIVANCTNKNPYLPPANTMAGCNGDKICFTGIQSSDSNKKDTVRLKYNGGIPKALFSTQFNGSTCEEFTLCWQTDSNDTLARPYSFNVTATDDACPLNSSYARTYTIKLGRRVPSTAHKVTHISCGKVKLESPKFKAKFGDNFKYSWTVSGKQYFAKDTIVDYNYDSSNIIRLSITNNGCIESFYDTLFNLPKSLKLNIGTDTSTCPGSTVTLKAKVSDGFPPYKYLWRNANAVDTLDSFTNIFNTSTKNICRVTDSFGCEKYDTNIIKVFKLTNLYLGPDTIVCQGDTIMFDAGKSFSSYQWLDLNSNNPLSKTRYLYTASSGNFAINVVDTNGCGESDTVTVSLRIPKTANVSNQRKCAGETITFDAGPNYKSYLWRDLGTGSIVSNTQTLYAVANQKFLITTIDSNTCTASDTVEAFFNLAVIYKQFTSPVCQYDTVKLQAWGADYIEWRNINDTTLLYTGDTLHYSFDKNTKFIVKGYTTIGGVTCTASDTVVISIFSQPTVSLSLSNDTLYAHANPVANSYIWSLDAQYYNISSYPWQYLTKTGVYTVKIIDTNGCFANSQPYTVTALHNYISNPQNIEGLKIYPNPSTGIYYIESTSTINDLTIYDLMGRKVYNNSANKNIIDLSTQPEGIYLLQINGNVWVRLSKL